MGEGNYYPVHFASLCTFNVAVGSTCDPSDGVSMAAFANHISSEDCCELQDEPSRLLRIRYLSLFINYLPHFEEPPRAASRSMGHESGSMLFGIGRQRDKRCDLIRKRRIRVLRQRCTRMERASDFGSEGLARKF